jgi:hypothetical protein
MDLQSHPDPSRQLSAEMYDIYHCCVYSKNTPDGGQRNCPKHVEFHSKNKFEKLVHLVGFIIRIYHDARSHERQIQNCVFCDKVFSHLSGCVKHHITIW